MARVCSKRAWRGFAYDPCKEALPKPELGPPPGVVTLLLLFCHLEDEMADTLDRTRDLARWALAGIRLVNGCLGLFAPVWLAHRLGADPSASPAALYALRLFGVRTIVIGADLLQRAGPARDQALRVAPVIHASDTVAAALGRIRGKSPRRVVVTTVLISFLNTVLAVLARPRQVGGRND